LDLPGEGQHGSGLSNAPALAGSTELPSEGQHGSGLSNAPALAGFSRLTNASFSTGLLSEELPGAN